LVLGQRTACSSNEINTEVLYVMAIIKLLYYTLFNFIIKKDGYSIVTHVAASFFLLVLLLCAAADILLILNIIVDNLIGFSHLRKGVIMFVIFSGGLLNYLLVFNILKFEKIGDAHNRMFTLEPKKYELARVIIITILVSLCILLVIDILQQYHNEQRSSG
jgi:hypothetical protein